MRPLSLAVLVAAAAPSASAQNNEFEIYPHTSVYATTFVSRAQAGGAECEIAQEVPGPMFAGVGDDGTACAIHGFRVWFVDENPSTSEQYQFVLRNNDPVNGGPLPSPGGEIARLPSGATFYMSAPGGTTRSTYVESQSFATPVAVPCQGGFSMGVALPPAQWPSMDGFAPWVAYYYPPTSRNIGDNPRPSAPNHAYVLTQFGQSVAPTGQPQTVRIRAFVTTPILNVGGIDPAWPTSPGTSCYGAGGLYPQVDGSPRSDGLDIRVQDFANPNGQAVVFFSTGISPFGPIPVFSFGNMYLDPTVFIGVWSGNLTTLGPSGMGVVPFLPPGSIPVSAVGARLALQGLTTDASLGNVRMTNLQMTSL